MERINQIPNYGILESFKQRLNGTILKEAVELDPDKDSQNQQNFFYQEQDRDLRDKDHEPPHYDAEANIHGEIPEKPKNKTHLSVIV